MQRDRQQVMEPSAILNDRDPVWIVWLQHPRRNGLSNPVGSAPSDSRRRISISARVSITLIAKFNESGRLPQIRTVQHAFETRNARSGSRLLSLIWAELPESANDCVDHDRQY